MPRAWRDLSAPALPASHNLRMHASAVARWLRRLPAPRITFESDQSGSQQHGVTIPANSSRCCQRSQAQPGRNFTISSMLYCSKWSKRHGQRYSFRSARGAGAQTNRRIAVTAPAAAKQPADFGPRSRNAPQQRLLIGAIKKHKKQRRRCESGAAGHLRASSGQSRRCPYSDLSIFQKIGVAGPSSTPDSDFRQAEGARYCPSGM